MNSPKFLNYEIRPLKFAERKMLSASLTKICNHFKGEYQYIGLGGLTFTDFKLFHKELHISELTSIEGGDFSLEKLEYNAPFSFIKIIKDMSTNVLGSIDYSKKSIVWLDYDGVLEEYMFTDLRILFSKLPKGSVYLVTCNRELKDNETQQEYTLEQFKDEFGTLVPFKLTNTSFSGKENFNTIRTMFSQQIDKALKERNNAENEESKFFQLFNLCYQENRGARMYTFGGFIGESSFDLKTLELSSQEIVKTGEEPFHLKFPNLTLKEMDLINKNFGDEVKLQEMNIFKTADVKKYYDTYKYLPMFLDVRM
jgi:hypothetical protein